MTFEEWWARRLAGGTARIGPLCDAPVTKRQARIIFSAGAWTERERCVQEAYEVITTLSSRELAEDVVAFIRNQECE